MKAALERGQCRRAPGSRGSDHEHAAAGDRQGPGVITAHGPRPGENPGDYETTPYHPALHTLGLSPLLDTIPPF